MSGPRLKMETGARDEDERDDRSRGGLFHRTPKQFRPRLPGHAATYICTSCGATVDQAERKLHADWHQNHADWDELWQADHERIAEIQDAQTEKILQVETQVELLTKIIALAVGPDLDRILAKIDGQGEVK